MKVTCGIVEDLLPLYMEDMCSEESKAALEEHIEACPACSEKAARMKNGAVIPQMKNQDRRFPIADYVKKVKRHRIRVGISAALICALAVCVLVLLGLTIIDMRREANPYIFEVENGVYDLTSAALECTAEDIGQYIFYTNSTKIEMTVKNDDDFHGTVMLWDTQYGDNFIQINDVDEKADTCIFTACSAAKRYKITCEGLAGATITVCDGRTVNFWNSFIHVVNGLTGK